MALVRSWNSDEPSMSGTLKDPGTEHAVLCPARYGGYGCTLAYGHDTECPHIAGDGETICAIWWEGDL